jgi:hypothetical protein
MELSNSKSSPITIDNDLYKVQVQELLVQVCKEFNLFEAVKARVNEIPSNNGQKQCNIQGLLYTWIQLLVEPDSHKTNNFFHVEQRVQQLLTIMHVHTSCLAVNRHSGSFHTFRQIDTKVSEENGTPFSSVCHLPSAQT